MIQELIKYIKLQLKEYKLKIYWNDFNIITND